MDGTLVNQVTRGEWDTDELLGIDQKKGILYYTSAESSPLQRDVYAIKLDGSGKRKLSTQEGTNRAAFSAGFRYYISFHSTANQPPCVTLCDNTGKTIRVLEDNTALKEKMKKSGFTPKEFITIPAADDVLLNAYIIRPPGFNAERQYPVLMNVYGGPESQSVTDGWDNGMSWEQMLAQQGYIVVCVDNRGTDGRGEAFRKATYLQLGKLETEDQIAAAEYLASLPFVDKQRIGIWGWSYGGYMSLLCLMKGSHVFSAAIAVAPVTSWRFYDTIYTERFMRKPKDNASGYDDNSPINHVDKLKGNLLLVHGTADDNVHVQQSMELAKKLIQADKKFDMAFYPDKNHGIYGGNTRLHLYRKMTDFILENL
jgi:dipeptidyl-peptidase-4